MAARRSFEQLRSFDGAGNVSSANTTLPAGTDNQAFCYDEQDRLTRAGSTGPALRPQPDAGFADDGALHAEFWL
jgi:hypothetical protein